MRPALIRGLWGNSLMARRASRPPDAFAAVLKSTIRAYERQDEIDSVYVFGQDNVDFLRYHGYRNVIKLDNRSFCAPKVHDQYHHRWDGAWVHGHSYWWHKLRIIEAALRDYPDGVIWMDFDIQQMVKPVPSWFWDEIVEGPPFKASLYRQRNWCWGAGWRYSVRWNYPHLMLRADENPKEQSQIVPGCGFLYIREKEVIKTILDIQRVEPFWLDHQLFAFYLDEKHGRWIGAEKYVELGYHTTGYYYGRQLLACPPQDTIWQSGGREHRKHVSTRKGVRS